MKNIIIVALLILGFGSVVLAAPYFQQTEGLVPVTTNTYYIGTSTPSLKEYKGIYTKDLTVSGTCTGCGSGLTAYDAFTHPAVGQSATTSQMNMAGLLSTASSTIGNGTTQSGLTISGSATTTLDALFLSGVNIDGTTRLATSLTGFLKATSGTVSAVSGIVAGDISLTKGNLLVGNDAGVAQATSTIFISSLGNVGIGTTTPGTLLSIGGDATGWNFRDGTTATSTGSGNLHIKGNLQVDGGYTALVTLVASGNATISGDLTIGSLTGLLKGTSGLVSVASAGTDYENPLTFSFPLIRTTNAISFGGLSTSTPAVISNIPYFTGANTFANVATSSLAVGASITSSGTLGYQIGGTASSLSLNMANANTWTALQTFGNSSATQMSITSTGHLYIPNGADPSIASAGDLAINTTAASSSLRYFDGTAERSLFPDGSGGLPFASSTLTYLGAFGAAGTTTIKQIRFSRPTSLLSFYCDTDVGTAYVTIGNGTASTTGQCTGAGPLTTSSVTWVMGQVMYIGIGTSASSPNIITVSPRLRKDAD